MLRIHNYFEKEICKYLIKGNNFKRIYSMLCANYNPSFSKWIHDDSPQSATGIQLTRGGVQRYEVCYRDILRFNKQSLAFYTEVLPFFYEYVRIAGVELKQAYSLLDVGPRTGAGANLLGQVFADEQWGYLLKLVVDTTDINPDWNDFIRLMPYIHQNLNVDIFTMEENTYDFCFCSHTIEHLDDPVGFVKQLKKIARKFAFITCPFEEAEPIPGHHTVTREIVERCEPKYIKTYKSVNRWKSDLECVVFAV